MDYLQHFFDGNIDIFLLSETKLDVSFPNAQFYLKGYSQSYRLDRSKNGGGLLLHVREDIPSKKLNTNLPADIESFFIKINLRKVKWLLCCRYNPQNSVIKHHLACITRELDTKKYDHFIVLGDFDCKASNDFCEAFNFSSLVKEPTCFKNPENPSCIDLVLTNRSSGFQNTTVMVTGISDFHKLTFTVMKMYFPKKKPIVIRYRNYKNFNNQIFQTELCHELKKAIYTL